jgi:hypothetical protein
MRGALSVRHSENIVERVARVSSLQLRGMIQRFTCVQYINKKFIAIEGLVSDHPWITVAFFVMGVAAVFTVVKRLFLDEDDYTLHSRGKKEARLD